MLPVTSHLRPVSVSQIGKLAECEMMWAFAYIGERRGASSVSTEAGSAFHEAAEWYERARANGLAVGHDALAAAAVQRLWAAADLHELKVWGKATPQRFMDETFDQWAEAYVSQRRADEDQGMAMLEPEQRVALHQGGHDWMIGYVDQLLQRPDGDLVVRDLKTGKPKPWHAMQIECYIEMVAQQRHQAGEPAVPVTGQIFYLPTGKVEPVVKTMSSGAIFDLVGAAQRRIGELRHEKRLPMATGIFTDACGLCDFRAECPAGEVGERNVEVG